MFVYLFLNTIDLTSTQAKSSNSVDPDQRAAVGIFCNTILLFYLSSCLSLYRSLFTFIRVRFSEVFTIHDKDQNIETSNVLKSIEMMFFRVSPDK